MVRKMVDTNRSATPGPASGEKELPNPSYIRWIWHGCKVPTPSSSPLKGGELSIGSRKMCIPPIDQYTNDKKSSNEMESVLHGITLFSQLDGKLWRWRR